MKKNRWKRFLTVALVVSIAGSYSLSMPFQVEGASFKEKQSFDSAIPLEGDQAAGDNIPSNGTETSVESNTENSTESNTESSTESNTESEWFNPYLELSETELVMAVGTEGKTVTVSAVSQIPEGAEVMWTSSEPKVASVDRFGNVIPHKSGTAEITATIVEPNGTRTGSCHVIITNPSLSSKRIDMNLSKDLKANFEIKGIDPNSSKIQVQVSDEEALSAWRSEIQGKYMIRAYKTGTYTLTIQVDGKTLKCPVKIIRYCLNSAGTNLYAGQKKTLKVYGTSKKITWKSSKPDIVSVNKKGEIKAKKKGIAKISATVNGATLNSYICVVDKKAIQALKKARSALGATYSQNKRMMRGYYDCSSLVWRSYSPYGVTLGSYGYAPTAAEEARWCVEHKKVIANGGMEASKLKLQAGDLIFYAREKNGRYKDICHVAMFAGYQANNEKSWEVTDPVRGMIVEATGDCVSENEYYNFTGETGKRIVMIARPTK